MQDYKPLIVANVQRSIGAMNDIIATLQRDAPLTSDLMENLNYPQNANFRAASQNTSQWLVEMGDQLLRLNLEESHRVEASVRETSSQLAQTNEQRVTATTNRINSNTLNEIGNANTSRVPTGYTSNTPSIFPAATYPAGATRWMLSLIQPSARS
ncbi:hypothetical protein V8D89_015436 [Ganoderma adspersum]